MTDQIAAEQVVGVGLEGGVGIHMPARHRDHILMFLNMPDDQARLEAFLAHERRMGRPTPVVRRVTCSAALRRYVERSRAAGAANASSGPRQGALSR
ncbi:hypothetical protein [Falsiroseomonas sp. CW058]|uniref:hypothetical protein n=1 Tax=Falsiroseomonas sp. CW058 TaxID=3388664 RepID=UPI003D31407D